MVRRLDRRPLSRGVNSTRRTKVTSQSRGVAAAGIGPQQSSSATTAEAQSGRRAGPDTAAASGRTSSECHGPPLATQLTQRLPSDHARWATTGRTSRWLSDRRGFRCRRTIKRHGESSSTPIHSFNLLRTHPVQCESSRRPSASSRQHRRVAHCDLDALKTRFSNKPMLPAFPPRYGPH